MLQKLSDPVYITVGIVLLFALLILVRILFQKHRNKQRRCRKCGAHTTRSHVATLQSQFPDQKGYFIVTSSTLQTCVSRSCYHHLRPDAVKAYKIPVPVSWFSFRYWKFRHLLPGAKKPRLELISF